MEKLEKYGVQEMNVVEMKEVDGGKWLRITGLFSWATGNTKWSDVEIELFGWHIKE